MKRLASTLTALALLLAIVAPVAAAPVHGDTVTVTFKLTLNGNVPKDESFAVAYNTREGAQAGGPPRDVVVFCGQPNSLPPTAKVVTVSKQDCVGNGKTYAANVQLPAGTAIYYLYVRLSESTSSPHPDIFYTNVNLRDLSRAQPKPSDFQTLNADTTIAAYYTYPGGQPKMPATGAGRASRASLPVSASAVLLVLAACGLGLRRYVFG